jgi:acyl-CoA thioesterase I
MSRILFAVLMMLMATATLAKSSIVVLGDSISAGYGLELGQGWVSLVQKKLADTNSDYTIENESITGDTSAGGLARLDSLLTTHKPKILILELGANDGLRGLSPMVLKQTLAEIIHRTQKTDAKVLLLGIKIPPNYGKRYIEMFYAVYPQLARELKVATIPFVLEDVALEKGLMQADGLHPNAKAQPIIADKVWQYLQPFL